MKYLMLYEAFKSSNIRKTLSYVNDSDRKSFMQFLKMLNSEFNIAIDKITDDDIIYKRAKKAKEIHGSSDNEFELHSIKLWFNSGGEILGWTVTPNDSDILASSNYKYIDNYIPVDIIENELVEEVNDGGNVLDFMNSVFDIYIQFLEDNGFDEELEDFKNNNNNIMDKFEEELRDYWDKKTNLGSSSGNISSARSGDIATIYLTNGNYGTNQVKGIIYKANNGRYYLLHNDDRYDGSSPNDNRDEYSKYFPKGESYGYSWVIYSPLRDEWHDAHNLKLVKPKINLNNYDYPAEISGFVKYNGNIQKQSLTARKWKWALPSITFDKYDKADFALVFKFDNLEFVKDIKKEREERKRGAFLTNDQIRQQNIDRYAKAISKKYLNLEDPKSLSKLVSTLLGGKYMLFAISSTNKLREINTLNSRFGIYFLTYEYMNSDYEGPYSIPEYGQLNDKEALKSLNEEIKNLLEKQLIDLYKLNFSHHLSNSVGFVKDWTLDDFSKIPSGNFGEFIKENFDKIKSGILKEFSDFEKLSVELNNKVVSKKVTNLYELDILLNNLSKIKSLFLEYQKLSSRFQYIFKNGISDVRSMYVEVSDWYYSRSDFKFDFAKDKHLLGGYIRAI